MPTAIEWTDETWNPIRARLRADPAKVGWHCEHKSPGCANCYAETLNERRFGTGLPYKPGHRKDVEIFLDETVLLKPMHWRKPRTIFVCSMTDLFGEFVTDAMIDRAFAVMALCPQHTFQVLTKRADRMRAYMNDPEASWRRILAAAKLGAGPRDIWYWPPPNVWLGVSIEDQARADERIPDLLATPAVVRFLSCEPLLGPLELGCIEQSITQPDLLEADMLPVLKGEGWIFDEDGELDRIVSIPKIDWVICGGESGPGARPMHPDWASSLRDQCAAAGVPFFFKQWGAFAPDPLANCISASTAFWPDGTIGAGTEAENGGLGTSFWKVSKKTAGRLLDGVEHSGMPGGSRG